MALLRDPYEVLDLDRSADVRQVKRAYRRLAKRYHPDAARDDGRAFLALRLAYETLSDPDRRVEWDRRHPSGGYRRPAGAVTGRRARSERSASGRPGSDAVGGNGHVPRPRDPQGRFVRPDAAPWWEEIRGGRSVGVDLPGSRGDPHLGPSSSGAAWSSASRAYFRRLTRQESGGNGRGTGAQRRSPEPRRKTGQPGSSR